MRIPVTASCAIASGMLLGAACLAGLAHVERPGRDRAPHAPVVGVVGGIYAEGAARAGLPLRLASAPSAKDAPAPAILPLARCSSLITVSMSANRSASMPANSALFNAINCQPS